MTPEALAFLAARAYRHATPWSAAQFAASLADPHTLCLHEDRGFALGRVVFDTAELLGLAVAPEAQGRGTGSRLLGAFEAAAAERGASEVLLEVAARNDPARALYARAGYALTGRRPRYYRLPDGGDDDALCLQKKLTPRQGERAPPESSKSC